MGLGPLGDDVLPGGEAVVGESLVPGEAEEILIASQNVRGLGKHPLRGGGVLGYDKEHAVVLSAELRCGEGHRGAREGAYLKGLFALPA